jgi:integrase
MKGSTYRRCYCRGDDGKPLGKVCPKLSSRRHGTWAVRQELPPRADGSRRSFSRAGYETSKKAQADLDAVRALLDIPAEDDTDGQVTIGDLLEAVSKDKKAPLPDLEQTKKQFQAGLSLTAQMTVEAWLDEWISAKTGRRTAIRRDEGNIRNYLKPHLGHLRLDRLRVSHLTEMFKAIAAENERIAENNALRRKAVEDLKAIRSRASRRAAKEAIAAMPPFRRPVGSASMQRIRATLRVALNDAIAQQVGITFNPAEHVRMDPAKRAKALVWTPERVAEWQRTGKKPSPVMVWTPKQTGQFLDHATSDRLYALYHLITFRGLRRGEACGQMWTETDLDNAELTVARELVVDGWEVYEDDPKTEASEETIALDKGTVAVLRAHKERQDAERKKMGAAWQETGRVFTKEDGSWLHPVFVSDRFEELAAEAGLPPIRLHDLRHGAATLALASGADMKVVQAMLRHSSIKVTMDIYTSVLPEVARAAAEAAADLVPRAIKPANGEDEPEEQEAAELPPGTSAHAPLTQKAPDEESEALSDQDSPDETPGEDASAA